MVEAPSLTLRKGEFLLPADLTIAFLLVCARANEQWNVTFDYTTMTQEKCGHVVARFEGASEAPNEYLFGLLLNAAINLAVDFAGDDGTPDNTRMMGLLNRVQRTINPWDEYDPYWDRRLPVSDTSW